MKTDKSKQGKTNKRKGNSAEREFVNIFKELGYSKCVTARYGSRLHDDCGIDLINIPFNVQVKAGYTTSMSVNVITKLLDNITENVKEKFLPDAKENDNPNIVVHKKNGDRGKKRKASDTLVYLTFEDFIKIINNKK